MDGVLVKAWSEIGYDMVLWENKDGGRRIRWVMSKVEIKLHDIAMTRSSL
jgi:hypothetical protein